MGCSASRSVPATADSMQRARDMSGSTQTLLLAPAPVLLVPPAGFSSQEAESDSRPTSARTVVMGLAPGNATEEPVGRLPSPAEPKYHLIKILLLGDHEVGKSKLADAFAGKRFGNKYLPTVGVEFHFAKVLLQSGVEVGIQLWDVSGSYREGAIACPYVAELCDAAIVVADQTRSQTLESADWYLKDCRSQVAAPCRGMPTLLLLNKSDLPEDARVGDFKDLQRVAKEKGYHACYRVSVATRKHVTEALLDLVGAVAATMT